MLTEEQKEAEAKRDQEYAQEREAIARKWKSHLLTRWAYRLADWLTIGEEELTRPGIWIEALYVRVLEILPWTRAHRFLDSMNATTLYMADDGRVHVCRFAWEEMEQEAGREARYCLLSVTCDNWQELEPEALTYLKASGKTLAEGHLTTCPKPLADRARWGDYNAGLQAFTEGKGK